MIWTNVHYKYGRMILYDASLFRSCSAIVIICQWYNYKYKGNHYRGGKAMLHDASVTDANLTSEEPEPFGQRVRLLDRMRHAIRRKHYSLRTENSYIEWVKRYIYFHQKRHPENLDEGISTPSSAIWPLIGRLPVQPKIRPCAHWYSFIGKCCTRSWVISAR